MIRRAAPADAEAIHRLMLAAFTPYRDQYTDGCFDATVLDPERIQARMDEGPVWVFDDGALRGTVSAVQDGRGLYVRGMAVHPEARRQGIGRQLLDTAAQYAVEVGAPCLWLSTTHFLHGSIALYQEYGFLDAPGPPDLRGTPLRSFQLETARFHA